MADSDGAGGRLPALQSTLDLPMPATSNRQFWTEAAVWSFVSVAANFAMNLSDVKGALLRGVLGVGLPFGVVYAMRYVGWWRRRGGRAGAHLK